MVKQNRQPTRTHRVVGRASGAYLLLFYHGLLIAGSSVVSKKAGKGVCT